MADVLNTSELITHLDPDGDTLTCLGCGSPMTDSNQANVLCAKCQNDLESPSSFSNVSRDF